MNLQDFIPVKDKVERDKRMKEKKIINFFVMVLYLAKSKICHGWLSNLSKNLTNSSDGAQNFNLLRKMKHFTHYLWQVNVKKSNLQFINTFYNLQSGLNKFGILDTSAQSFSLLL